jgi:hypothetical protein
MRARPFFIIYPLPLVTVRNSRVIARCTATTHARWITIASQARGYEKYPGCAWGMDGLLDHRIIRLGVR